MLFVDVIRKKRDGLALDEAELQLLVDGLSDGSLPAEQISAFAMAVFLNSMSFEEAGLLTRKMARSGLIIDWQSQHLDGPVIDKHSTGGIGDKVSFLLAPIAAACGCFVPMISGRGLGHSGGTLDKVGSVPGYDPLPDPERFKSVVRDVGCAIIGQTGAIAPADRRFYAIRDITGTVESVPLITASILSKKIAAGLQGLVMDVKYGSGAFMATHAEARKLATSIIGIGQRSGLVTHALLTDMNENLGSTAGNALEIQEAVRFLIGESQEPRLADVTYALVAEMLIVGGLQPSREDALAAAHAAVASGRAAEVFGRMVAALGGPADFMERFDNHLPTAPVLRSVAASSNGYLSAVDGRRIGNAIIELGGGRRTLGDELDLAVGFADLVPIGTAVESGMAIATVHAANDDDARIAAGLLLDACTFSDDPPANRPVVLETLTAASG
ncbi:MAG: thymidine phosphorylase [Pseudomonadota bacterium]